MLKTSFYLPFLLISTSALGFESYRANPNDNYEYLFQVDSSGRGTLSTRGAFTAIGNLKPTKWMKWNVILESDSFRSVPIDSFQEKQAKTEGISYFIAQPNYNYVIANGHYQLFSYGSLITLPLDLVRSTVVKPFKYKGEFYQLINIERSNAENSGSFLVRRNDSQAVKLDAIVIQVGQTNHLSYSYNGSILQLKNGTRFDLKMFDQHATNFGPSPRLLPEAPNPSESPSTKQSNPARPGDAALELDYIDMTTEVAYLPKYISPSDQRVVDEVLPRILSTAHETKSSVILGEPGVGKTTLAKQILTQLPADWKMYALDATTLTAGATLVGITPARVKKMIEMSKKEKIVWYIDEIHTLSGQGAYSGNSTDVIQMMKAAIASGDLIILGASTSEEYYEAFGGDGAVTRRFKTFELDPPTPVENFQKLQSIVQLKNLQVSESALTRIAELAGIYGLSSEDPSRSIELLNAVVEKVKEPTVIDVERIAKSFYKIPDYVHNDDALRNLLTQFSEKMAQQVVGMETARASIEDLIIRGYSGLHDGNGPMVSMLLDGSAGAGKTSFSKAVAESLGLPYTRIELNRVGANYTEEDVAADITKALRKNQFAVINIDEIDKAPKKLAESFLLALENGILTTRQWANSSKKKSVSVRVSVKNAIFIFTSNEKSQLSVPFLSRLQEVISVKTLNPEQLKKVVKMRLNQRITQLGLQNLNVTIKNLDQYVDTVANEVFGSKGSKQALGFGAAATIASSATPLADTRKVLQIAIRELDVAVAKAKLSADFQPGQPIDVTLTSTSICNLILNK